MSGEQDLDRNEKASPYKLEEARKRGQVAKSQDLMSLAVMLVAAIGFFALVPTALRAMGAMLARGMATGTAQLGTAGDAAQLVSGGLFAALQILSPLLFVLVVVVVASQMLQTGPIFSSTPLKPDWTRLNPVSGFKKLLSLRLLFEAVKSVLKLLALAAVAYMALHALMPGVAQWHNASAKTFIFSTVDAAGSLAIKMCAALAVFALIDVLFVRWDYMKNLRMSRRELTDEHKHREGDPRIKSRLRELRQEFLRRTRAVKNVPQADVLITNPTHIAIALQYRHGESPAPRVLAKGAGGLARRMRDIAYRSNVPVVQSPVLARALFKEVEQETYVPERWYPQIAKILVWVQASKAARSAQGSQAQGASA
jgi:flagellar biosynthesis protein FlhB